MYQMLAFYPHLSVETVFKCKVFSIKKLLFNILLSPGIFANSGVLLILSTKNLRGILDIPSTIFRKYRKVKAKWFSLLFYMKGSCKTRE